MAPEAGIPGMDKLLYPTEYCDVADAGRGKSCHLVPPKK